MYFTTTQVVKLHDQFAHPSAEKHYKMLKRARPEETAPETMRQLEELSKRCDPCQRIQNAPTIFRVSFGADNVRFNERLLMDIMYLYGKPVLHMVDEGTRFSAAKFVPDVSTKTIWETIIQCWAMVYTGLPRKILVDQGSSFGESFGDIFMHIGDAGNVEIQRTGVESHSSLGLGERYHHSLRYTYRKLKIAYSTVSESMLLSTAVKALNDTLGPEGLVPSALVFGEFPSAYTTTEYPRARKTLESRALVANAARRDMEKQMAQVRVQRALRHATPAASSMNVQEGHEVLVWREIIINNRVG